MPVLETLNRIYQQLTDRNAIVRIDIDKDAHGDHCRIAIIADGVYASGIAEDADWLDPDALIAAILAYFQTGQSTP